MPANPVIDSFSGQHRFLSNFYLADVIFDGNIYPSVEHAYQAAKTRDVRLRQAVRKARTAGEAKRMGREIILRPDWEAVKTGHMLVFLRRKFSHEYLRDKLTATGQATLIEGNTWGDRIWGVCGGVGENRLGKLLMRVRAEANGR